MVLVELPFENVYEIGYLSITLHRDFAKASRPGIEPTTAKSLSEDC